MDSDSDLYRIGTVASLTGIAVERLRAWERRHGLVPAHKSGRTRFYSKVQLEQLSLIKRLLDQGQPISSLINLTHTQLMERLQGATQQPVVVPTIAPQVGLIGPNLLVLEQQQGIDQRIDVVSRWANLEAFTQDRSGTNKPTIVFAQLPVLSLQPIDLITDIIPQARVIPVYQFATADAIESVNQAGVPLAKWPLTWPELEHLAIVEQGLSQEASGVPARHFSDEELIAMAVSQSDPSGRLQQLVELLQQANAFVSFAQVCEREGFAPASDLAFHVSTARTQLEQALEQYNDRLDQEHSAAQNLSVQNINKM
ncbi:MAG: MerR family transcriptional regulator [Pseudomonadota bacterium]